MRGTPKLTKATYELVAKILKEAKPAGWKGDNARWDWLMMIGRFTKELEATNPLFDKRRFEDACGIESFEDRATILNHCLFKAAGA